MGHRDHLRENCWRWLDPKKAKKIIKKLTVDWRNSQTGNWRIKGRRGYNEKEERIISPTTMMTSFCPLLCNSSANSGKPT